MKITGLQITGNIVFVGSKTDIVYITDFKQMTIDTDKSNRIITLEELEKIIENLQK